MNTTSKRQRGGSTIGNILVLAVVGYAVYIAIQYTPQFIEARSVQSILDTMRETQRRDPVDSVEQARSKIVRLLQINEMDDLLNNVEISGSGGRFQVTVSWDRPLNLVYEQKTIHYSKTVRL